MKKIIVFYSVAALLIFGFTRSFMTTEWQTGSLRGAVTDPSGAVVPGAKIVLSSNRGSETLSTGGTGEYVATGLAPGAYRVTVSANCFAPLEQAGIQISAGRRIKMDVSLGLAALTQVITVTADAPRSIGSGAGQ